MIENIPDAPEIRQAMRTGENGYSYSPEPPAGMEGYRWTDAGCWVTDTEVEN